MENNRHSPEELPKDAVERAKAVVALLLGIRVRKEGVFVRGEKGMQLVRGDEAMRSLEAATEHILRRELETGNEWSSLAVIAGMITAERQRCMESLEEDRAA